jgi:heme/copper-type cytochrome/quinol oxidase subunit 1
MGKGEALTLHADPIEPRSAVARRSPGKVVVAWVTTTDHKTISSLYTISSLLFFLLGGVMALFMRAELARPGTQLLVGFHLTFLVQHWLGAEGMFRGYAGHLAADGSTALNTVSTIGAILLGASTLPFLYNVWKTAKYGTPVAVDDPWGHGRSPEWAASCPPPRHNFRALPRVRSEPPALDLHNPAVAAIDQAAHTGRRDVIDVEEGTPNRDLGGPERS